MKISEQWLREWVNPDVSTETLAEQLTMLGLEVDEVLPAAGDFTEVIVAEIIGLEKHPDADKLNVCTVNTGADTSLQIVCGAPNVKVGLKAPLAKIGALLPGGFKIKKSKLRGLESFGMLCSNVELGLSDDHSGLLELPSSAPVGEDIRSYLQLNDNIIDIDLTPNRADCFSVKGIAIDVACLNNSAITMPTIVKKTATHEEKIEVNVEAVKQCPSYLCRVINNIDNTVETPMWMQEKLRRGGIRAIHPVVDVTNYVMLELGQPMHGFDKAAISGSIIVKMASKGDRITLLDGKDVELNESFLMIADQDKYLAIAGVMGGQNSGVESDTRDIVLESAFFDPATIMGKSRDLGIHTESAHRFERGVDPLLQRQAMHRATQLIVEICGGEVGEIVEQTVTEQLPLRQTITLSQDKLLRVLGFEVDPHTVTDILTGLHMQVEYDDDKWQVTPASSRFDINIPEDLIEEVVRIIGYDKMPSKNLFSESVVMQLPENIISQTSIKSQLNVLGYHEAINYSFISEKQLQAYGLMDGAIKLKNPLTEEFAIMRTSLLPGMMQSLKYNLRRQNDSIKFFESGKVFHKFNDIIEDDKLIAVLTGRRHTEHWAQIKDGVDFYDCKGDLEALLDNTKASYYFKQSKHEFLHPGRQAEVMLDDQCIGWIGQVHPQVCAKIGIKKEVYAFELHMKNIMDTLLPEFHEVSKFPSVRRDIAMIVDDNISYQQINDIISQELGELMVDCFVFDKYQGENIQSGKRSLAVGVILQQQNSTFEDKEVDKLLSKVVSSIKENLDVEIRGH